MSESDSGLTDLKADSYGVYCTSAIVLRDLFDMVHGSFQKEEPATAVVRYKTGLKCASDRCDEYTHPGCVSLAHVRWSVTGYTLFLSAFCQECALKFIDMKNWAIEEGVSEAMNSHRNSCKGSVNEVFHLTRGI